MAHPTQNIFSAEETFVLDYIKGAKPVFNIDLSAEAIQAFALRNGLAPYLFHLIQDKKETVSEELFMLLKKDYLNSLFRNSRIQDAWHKIQKLFVDKGLFFIPLKGIFIATHIYPDFSARPMSDIDILLFGDDAYKSFELLLEKGGQISDEEPADHDKKTGHHLQGIRYKDVLIELHTSLFPLDVNDQIPNEVIEKSLVQYNGITTLLPMLNLCYLCLHAHSTMRRGGIRLSWFWDLILLSRSSYFLSDETDLSTLIKELHIEAPVLDILCKAEFLFDHHFSFLPQSLRKKMSTKELAAFISFIHNSNQQDTSQSYAIAFERLRNTKGLGNKIRFVKSVITRGGNNNVASIAKRLFVLSKRLVRMLFKR